MCPLSMLHPDFMAPNWPSISFFNKAKFGTCATHCYEKEGKNKTSMLTGAHYSRSSTHIEQCSLMCYVLVRGTRLDISGQLLSQGEDIVQLREVVEVCYESISKNRARACSSKGVQHMLCSPSIVCVETRAKSWSGSCK